MDKKVNQKHNGIISFWKFMFSIMIVIFHMKVKNSNNSTLMINGRIGVEFFFLVSGYLMAKTALNKEDNITNLGKETFDFIWKKFKKFFPHVLIGFLILFFLRVLYTKIWKNQIVNSIWNLLLLDMVGMNSTKINDVTWYISSMLISMWILYPLIRKYKRNYIYIIAPLIVWFIGGWLAYETEKISDPRVWMGITYKGTIRAFYELALGSILYEITQKIKAINFTFIGKLLLTIIETVGFISIFFIVNIQKSPNRYDFIMILILAISVTLAFSEKNIFLNLANNKFFLYLEKLSLPIYLNQYWAIKFIKKIAPEACYIIQILAIIACLFVFSMLSIWFVEKMKKIDKTKLRRIFIEKSKIEEAG